MESLARPVERMRGGNFKDEQTEEVDARGSADTLHDLPRPAKYQGMFSLDQTKPASKNPAI